MVFDLLDQLRPVLDLSGNRHLIKALAIANRQDQLSQRHRHPKFIKYIGVLGGHVHNHNICYLHLLADPAAYHII